MEQSDQILEFFSAFQQMALSPVTCTLDDEGLEHQFIAIVEQNTKRTTEDSALRQARQTSVIFANFGAKGSQVTLTNNDALQRFKICAPEPDELIQGWFGRLHAINCLPPTSKIEPLICEVAKQLNPGIDESDLLECASTLLGMSKNSFITLYSLLPFFNALAGLKPSKFGNKSPRHRKAYEKQAPFRLGSKQLKYCKACAVEDNTRLGYSYWRSSHQLPGMLWCLEHHHPLSIRPKSTCLTSPHILPDDDREALVHDLTETQVEALEKYSQIALKILSHAPDIDSVAASIALGRRASNFDYRVSKLGKRTTPSSLLMESFPDWWLQEIYPRAQLKPNNYNWVIDGACTPGATRYTTTTLCLLASVFYEDADAAINDLLAPTDTVKSRIKGFDYWASREILNAYIAHNGVVSKVAEDLSLPKSTVSFGLQNQGLPGLGKVASVIKAASDFLNGHSMKDSCKINSASIEETEALVRAFCEKIKPIINSIADKNQPTKKPSEKYAGKIKATA